MLTDGIMSAVEGWTGTRAIECPWRAHFDPFVNRVRAAYEAFVEGQMAILFPRPSHRLMTGVLHFHRAVLNCERKRLEGEREKMRQQSAAARAQQGGRRG